MVRRSTRKQRRLWDEGFVFVSGPALYAVFVKMPHLPPNSLSVSSCWRKIVRAREPPHTDLRYCCRGFKCSAHCKLHKGAARLSATRANIHTCTQPHIGSNNTHAHSYKLVHPCAHVCACTNSHTHICGCAQTLTQTHLHARSDNIHLNTHW